MSMRSKPISMDPKQEFAALIDGFDTLTSCSDELDEFSELIASFELIAAAVERESSPEMLLGFFNDFEQRWRDNLNENAASAPDLNIWTIADLGLDEVRNCRVLKWLLDPNETHCQGIRFLNCLLQAIREPPWADEDGRIRVYREVTMSEGDSRVDITIESSFTVLWIEAKILADGDLEQLERYSERARPRLRDRRFIGKLLEERGTSGEPLVATFTRMLWSDVAKALKRFGTEDGTSSAARNPFVARLARQYADFVDSHVKKKG
jgi:PD-(D/E)XK nuclease superfamily